MNNTEEPVHNALGHDPAPRRATLAQRIALLTIAVAVVTVLVAGVLSVGLIRKADESSARSTLARLAVATQATADLGPGGQGGRGGELRARRTLNALRVQYATFAPRGRITGNSSDVAVQALSRDEMVSVAAGKTIRDVRTVAGHRVIVDARPLSGGGFVLVQRQSDALAGVSRAMWRIVISLAVGMLVAVAAGIWFARRVARPLRQTAIAAQSLATGRRDVVVTPAGPAEVADVAEAVNQLAANLTVSEQRQRAFLMSVSHELRTPLTGLRGYAESLAEGVVPPDDVTRVGRVMQDEAQRLERLVTDLLDLARLDAADFRIEPIDVDIVSLVRSAGEVWLQRCAAADVPFDLQVPEHPIQVRLDPTRLRQAIDGLLENALRVTPAGRPIVLACGIGVSERSARPVVIEVRDGGPGLTDGDLAVAFERSALYERYRGVRQVGTGLGLAIVHGLVTRLGGTVEAGHAAEGGARFAIRF